MKRFVILTVALAMLAALSALPASATHEATPITITVQSTYAGLCGAKPGPSTAPAQWTSSLTTNSTGAAGAKVPTDLWKNASGGNLGDVSGPCDYGTDSIWNITGQVGIRGTANCNNVTRSEGPCRGLHYPGAGPPVQPGRFLNYAAHSATPDPRNLCLFVSTAAPNQGTCQSLAVGYTFAVGQTTSDAEIEGSYCGTSRGFGWALAIPSDGPTTWSVLEWSPTSAGSLLPISGVVTAANWQPNVHYKGWTGTKGKPSMRFADGTVKNLYGLTTARSYIAQVDVETGTPGSCGGELNLGGVSFFNQAVAIAIGDDT